MGEDVLTLRASLRLWRELEAVEGGRDGDEKTMCGRGGETAEGEVGGEDGGGGDKGSSGAPSPMEVCGWACEEGAKDEVEIETVALALRGRECDLTSSKLVSALVPPLVEWLTDEDADATRLLRAVAAVASEARDAELDERRDSGRDEPAPGAGVHGREEGDSGGECRGERGGGEEGAVPSNESREVRRAEVASCDPTTVLAAASVALNVVP